MIRPIGNRVFVKPFEFMPAFYGSIIIPEVAREVSFQGIVAAVGIDVRPNGNRLELEVKPGDHVMFTKYAAKEVEVDGEKFYQMREDEIIAIIEK